MRWRNPRQLNAAMRHHHDDIGGTARLDKRRPKPRMDDRRNTATSLIRDAKFPLTRSEDGHPNMAEIDNQRRIGVGLGCSGSHPMDSRRLQELERRVETVRPVIEQMIVSQPEYVETRSSKNCRLLRGDAKAGP